MRVSVKKYEGVFFRERKELFNGRPDRTYEFCWQEAGRKCWRTAGRLSRGVTAADAAKARLEALSGRALAGAGQDLSVAGVVQAWLAGAAPDKSSRCHARTLIRDLGGTRLADLTVGRLDDYKRQLLGERGLAESTARHVLVALASAINHAIRHGLWAGFNPVSRAAGFRMPRPDNKGERWLRPGEAERLLSALRASSPLWHDMALVSLHSGLRLTELYRLRVGDVDAGSMTAIVCGKGGRREPVALTQEAFGAIAGRGGGPGELVFRTGTGKRPDKSVPFARAVELLGLNEGVTDRRQRVWFHTLRHTFASWLVQGGVDLYTVQHLMRHRSPQMTQRYAHLDPARLRAPLEVIRRAMAGVPGAEQAPAPAKPPRSRRRP
ncbi:MAG: site-specific integrase [Deltaproteobacteria bacterium]|nr:site-specific integrase [Deltaproteobacteria bacterium]